LVRILFSGSYAKGKVEKLVNLVFWYTLIECNQALMLTTNVVRVMRDVTAFDDARGEGGGGGGGSCNVSNTETIHQSQSFIASCCACLYPMTYVLLYFSDVLSSHTLAT